MDFKTDKETVIRKEVLFNTVAEYPVEWDCVLADYYPDVARILKCRVEGKVLSCHLGEGTLELSGMICLDLYYCGEEGELECVSQQLPMSKTLEFKNPPPEWVCDVDVSVSYMNVRAMSERRVTVRGALSLKVQVTGCVPCELLTQAQGCGIELHQQRLLISEPSGWADSVFDLQEELPVGGGLPPVSSVLKTWGEAKVTEEKVISGKLILKGEVLLYTLYQPEGEGLRPELMSHSLPVNQIVDLEGVTEDSIPRIFLEVVSAGVTPRSTQEGTQLLSVEVRICAHVRCTREKMISYVDDAFSTEYETQIQRVQIPFEHVLEAAQESIGVKDTLDLSDTGIESVLDLRCDRVEAEVQAGETGLDVVGRMMVTVWYYAPDGMPRMGERPVDFSFHKEFSQLPPQWKCPVQVTVENTSFTLSGANRLDIRLQCLVSMWMEEVCEREAITQIQVLEDRVAGEPRPALTLYYADEGEKVWEIAKAYHTSAARIQEENELTGEEIEKRRMLLIPAVH